MTDDEKHTARIQELVDKIKKGRESIRHGDKNESWAKQIRSAQADLELELNKGRK